MLRFVLHDEHRLTMQPYLDRWAGEFRSHVELVSYDQLFRAIKLPRCTHVFTDLDRLQAEDAERAAHVWKTLRAGAPEIRQLNDPLAAMSRYELLRALHEERLNDFDVYRLTEARVPRRFPVFVRGEHDHFGPESGLLASQAELDASSESLCRAGKCRDTRIAVEFCAEPGPDGWYRKYAAYFVDGTIVPRHIMFSREGMVKAHTRTIDDEKRAEERRYVDANPHAAWIREVFRIARIDYGRIDYGVVGGRPQAYEINTNSTIFPAATTERSERNLRFAAELTQAYAALESRNGTGGYVTVTEPLHGWAGRVAGRVLAAVLRRQLRTPI
jgi:hypothetical protein